ncbi:hypothetical protein [Lentibacillus salicampi]|uniref:hypothetical protein n=1 Tax=Lentibacillus salicampi TaxID=175306 RepID=UPI00142FD567|nr:hypothetical protein [Lentibacillus salicampi]
MRIGNMDDREKIMEYTISYGEKGKKEGRMVGEQAAKQEIAVEMLRKGFLVYVRVQKGG